MTKPFLAALAGAALLTACQNNDSPQAILEPTVANDRIAAEATTGFVVTTTNAAAGNSALVFPRDAAGGLGTPTAYPTGGLGTGAGLGNQSGIIADEAGRFFYLVNAGSDQITVFERSEGGLTQRQLIGSGGSQPISLARFGRLLYVLNDGSPATVNGFRIQADGTLEPLSRSSRPLSAAVPDAAQIGFTRGGGSLIVTEKATGNILVFPVDRTGRLGVATVTPSNGATPFGFAVDRRGTVIVSEAFGGAPNGSALSSYRLLAGRLATVSPSVPTLQTAACWVAIDPSGRYAYTTNTASGSITGYRIAPSGHLERIPPDGISGPTNPGPIDLAVTRAGLLYSLNAKSGSISGFQIRPDGSLAPVGTTTGIPAGTNGLVAY